MKNSTVNKNEITLQGKIDSIESKLSDLQSQQEQIELDLDDFADQFDEYLDDSIPEIGIGCLTYSPSHVLKNVDPVAYRCGLNDFVDQFDVTETDEYKELQEQIDSLEDAISDLESELDDLFSELEEAKETE